MKADRRWLILTGLVVAAGVGFAYYANAVRLGMNTIGVTVTNATDGPLTDMMLGSPGAAGRASVSRLGVGRSVTVRVPLASTVAVGFRGPDGKVRRSRYEFPNQSGLTHVLRIKLTSDSTTNWGVRMKTTLLVGSEVAYDESLAEIDARGE